MRGFSVFGLSLKTVLIQAVRIEGVIQSHWLAMCPRASYGV